MKFSWEGFLGIILVLFVLLLMCSVVYGTIVQAPFERDARIYCMEQMNMPDYSIRRDSTTKRSLTLEGYKVFCVNQWRTELAYIIGDK